MTAVWGKGTSISTLPSEAGTDMNQYYVHPEDVTEETVRLVGDESKHLIRVMRAEPGERFLATNGLDEMYEVELISSSKESAEGRIVQRLGRKNEPSREVTLAVSLLRNPARFDFLVEKAVELGVRRIVPLHCERTIPKQEKRERIQKLALSAMKQSQRSWLPPVEQTIDLRSFLDRADSAASRIMLHEQADRTKTLGLIAAGAQRSTPLVLLVGPEGGFSEAEVRYAEGRGVQTASLGERRLRAETAAVAAIAITLAQ